MNGKYTLFTALAFAILLGGCALFPVTTESPTNPGKSVDRAGLVAEVKTFAAKVEAAEANLAEKEKIKATVVNLVASISEKVIPADYAGAFNTALLVLAGVSATEATTGVIANRKSKSAKASKET